METRVFRSTCTNLQISSPSLHFHTIASSLSPNFQPYLRLHRPLRTASLPSPWLVASPTPSRKPVTTACSLSDDGLPAQVLETGSSLELKKKAIDLASGLKGTSIFLLGMKSSIKSSVGKLLAEVLQYYYFDSDELLEEASGGEAAAKVFKETDEKAFRQSETEVLKQLSSVGRLVVCAGDGAVQSSTNLTLLRDGISVWIDIPLYMLSGGVVEQDNELPASEISAPGPSSEALTQLTATYQALRTGYATADATIPLQRVAAQLGYFELDEVTPEDVALEVLRTIEKLTRVKKMIEQAATPF